MADGGQGCAALLASIDGEIARLREMLAGRDEAATAERPPRGTWSVVEIVRHLLFAEQAHLGGLYPGAVPGARSGSRRSRCGRCESCLPRTRTNPRLASPR